MNIAFLLCTLMMPSDCTVGELSAPWIKSEEVCLEQAYDLVERYTYHRRRLYGERRLQILGCTPENDWERWPYGRLRDAP